MYRRVLLVPAIGVIVVFCGLNYHPELWRDHPPLDIIKYQLECGTWKIYEFRWV